MSDMSDTPVSTAERSSRPTSSLASGANFDLLSGVSVRVSVEVGSASLTLADLLDLNEGSVVELDRQANDLLEVFANGTLVARGEIVNVDGRYGIQIVHVAEAGQRLGSMERRS